MVLPNPAVSASVSCMDLGHMREQIETVESSAVSFFHYDVVDGKFNRCYILGDLLFRYLKKSSRLPIEAHLAVTDADPYIEIFAALGADYITVHYETLRRPLETLEKIRSLGAKPALAYRAETAPGEDFLQLADVCAWVLKLTVNPGFSGQKMQPAALAHIRRMRDLLKANGNPARIQADGNVNASTVKALTEAGATIFTGGTSGLFAKGRSIGENAKIMLTAADALAKDSKTLLGAGKMNRDCN